MLLPAQLKHQEPQCTEDVMRGTLSYCIQQKGWRDHDWPAEKFASGSRAAAPLHCFSSSHYQYSMKSDWYLPHTE